MVDSTATLNDSITEANLRSIGVSLTDAEYFPKQHRGYVHMGPDANSSMQRTSWEGPLKKEDVLPYYCPANWRRFAVKVPAKYQDNKHFWDNSSNLYHGLKPESVRDITVNGFKPSECQHQGKAVYLSPSIRYAAHPRYARVHVSNGRYYQVILQCRVLNSKLTKFQDAILKGGVTYEDSVASGEPASVQTMGVKQTVIDENHDNNLMEFLWFSDTTVTSNDGIVVTGVLVRCFASNPIGLTENRWWQEWRDKSYLEAKYTIKH